MQHTFQKHNIAYCAESAVIIINLLRYLLNCDFGTLFWHCSGVPYRLSVSLPASTTGSYLITFYQLLGIFKKNFASVALLFIFRCATVIFIQTYAAFNP